MSQFNPLDLSTLKAHSTYARPYFSNPGPVRITASALETMTDLKFVPAAIVLGDADLETATHKMIARGVRSLLVVDASEDVIGIVTARDAMGERARRSHEPARHFLPGDQGRRRDDTGRPSRSSSPGRGAARPRRRHSRNPQRVPVGSTPWWWKTIRY